ncbi:MAG: glyoxalase [Dehalococcoidia bacterium]|nr:glyoxalase [Dehalococcoidia bacterium]
MTTTVAIHPDTKLGAVALTVSSLDRSVAFYQNVLGFSLHDRAGVTAKLGAGGGDLLVLAEQPGARQVPRTTGLYHFAPLLPSRRELAHVLKRIADTQTSVQGLVDHWVSEAIYLSDPDGNGIEIDRDRPRAEWPPFESVSRRGNGPLDVDGILGELDGVDEPWSGLHPETVVGHMHLHVADVGQSRAFYEGVLGFEPTMNLGDTASFVAAGGYHHHIAFNTWAGVGAPPPPPDAVGLRHFVICLPNESELADVLDRVREAGLELGERDDGVYIQDPSRNGIVLKAA